ncbi:hypothetical protein Sgly_0355 [Syntrophobotulus glycolicus DSM 8271]|uniref:Uncharacterized protein n=1 Tax=Syntrophobotulus glycolicus (strain DSM 8271 / FlGlyR) TaxID=645991 RepID=F0SXH5_SYNGF|nr:hypothetical protein [Syntrophobotulus glycolicus]ADY54721.1 hypothetical protein Sgly_0355 [Syntrophobotulus glycolicus DSM 8271]
MLTNEQRAHDITLSILQSFKNEILREYANKANSTNLEVHFDYYTQYKNIYDTTLKAVNRDFSSER